MGELKKQKELLHTLKIELRDHLSNIDEIQKMAVVVSSISSMNKKEVKNCITDILQSWQVLNDQTKREDSRIMQEMDQAKKKVAEEQQLKSENERKLKLIEERKR